MTDPGAIEQVPVKVVPYYLEGEGEGEEPQVAPPPELPIRSAPRPALGILALVVAVGTAVTHAVAIVVASGGDNGTGTILGYLAIGLSVAAIAAGTVAIGLRRGRRWGIAAVILGLIANPFLLLRLLELASGLQN